MNLPLPEWCIAPAPVAYDDAVGEMEARVAAIRDGRAPELVWLLEHPPLYTAGTSADLADLRSPHRFPLHTTGRGGQLTYHGPGQRVAYVMLDLERLGDHCHHQDIWFCVDAIQSLGAVPMDVQALHIDEVARNGYEGLVFDAESALSDAAR